MNSNSYVEGKRQEMDVTNMHETGFSTNDRRYEETPNPEQQASDCIIKNWSERKSDIFHSISLFDGKETKTDSSMEWLTAIFATYKSRFYSAKRRITEHKFSVSPLSLFGFRNTKKQRYFCPDEESKQHISVFQIDIDNLSILFLLLPKF